MSTRSRAPLRRALAAGAARRRERDVDATKTLADETPVEAGTAPAAVAEALLAPADAGPPPPRRWAGPADWPAIGLPAPIRTLLESLP